MDVGARQVRRQRCTLGFLPLLVRRRWLQLLQLDFECSQVGVDSLVEQAHLLGGELLAALAELQALEHGDLVGELVDARLAVAQFPILLADLSHQLRSQRAQFVRAQSVEVGGSVHAASLPEPNPPRKQASLRPWGYYTTVIA